MLNHKKVVFTPRHEGFSMVEMAVVVVIIGLLVAGTMVGAGLLRQAELRALLSETEKYSIAIEHFNQLYGALPGDIDNVDGSNNFFDGDTDNGNGDGEIDADIPSGTEETFTAWDQLVLSRYISGNFTGEDDSGSATIGVNVPQSAHATNIGYSLVWVEQPAEGAQDALGRYHSNNYLIMAGDDDNISDPTVLTGEVLTPDDAFLMDQKSDNGFANSGKILGGGSNCFTGVNYALGDTDPVCFVYFNIQN